MLISKRKYFSFRETCFSLRLLILLVKWGRLGFLGSCVHVKIVLGITAGVGLCVHVKIVLDVSCVMILEKKKDSREFPYNNTPGEAGCYTSQGKLRIEHSCCTCTSH